MPSTHTVSSAALSLAAAFASVALVACGGGGSDDTPPPPPAGPTAAQRTAAATTTAQSTTNPCAPIRPFYWELGDVSGALASGGVTSTTDPTVYTATTVMSIASASKWMYSSYVVQKQAGALSDSDVKFLTFTSGYTNFAACLPGQTVQQCVDYGSNGTYSPGTDGRFSYGGGHMEKHASLIGLGALANGPLATEIRSQLGSDVTIAYSQPQLAGGIVTDAADYAVFLRKILRGDLRMRDALGTHAVCTNSATCASAVNAPVPADESWHYAVGHWVEDDPVVGDGAFSSPGAFGFYPWIDAGKTTYGVLARRSESGGGVDSVACGRLIRKAWATATPQ